VLGPSTFVRRFLLDVKVLALPDISGQVAEHGREVMVAAATGGGGFAEHAAANDATEALMIGVPPESGAAPKRGAVIFGQTI
jgi:hypothetical protein